MLREIGSPAALRLTLPLVAGALGLWAIACDASHGRPSADAAVDSSDARVDTSTTGAISLGFGSTANLCPTATVTAAPPTASVGQSVELRAWATDADGRDGGGDGALELKWTASTGAVSDPTSARTAFACTEPGLHVVRLIVSDGQCTQTVEVSVRCLVGNGPGNGADGAQPDGDGTGGATSAGSGSGGLSGSGGAPAGSGGRASSGGAPGSGGMGGSGGHAGSTGGSSSGGTPGSGGVSSAGGRTAAGGAPGAAGATAVGGARGMPGSGGTNAGSGGSTGSGGDSGAPPSMDEGDACNRCTEMNCNIATDGCDGMVFQNPADAVLCETLYACFRTNHCTSDADNDMLPDRDYSQWCWCGLAPDADASACFALPGKATGPCAAEVASAARTSDPAVIRLRFADPAYPLGRAANLAACRAGFCGAVCR